ncbi:MAG TPA: methyltransferase domain-containing protein [Candidatus Dormibacteraeota bacterium]|jgi:SAM-dependent methyltransferase|nr:methyltransferase domain-containing protein [Candidatus Dormibacteraeota bacterium]
MEQPSKTHQQAIQEEFSRTAEAFADRQRRRYAVLDPVVFSRLEPGQRVLEVAAGAGTFLAAFDPAASLAVALDLTRAMLDVARRDHPRISCVLGDGAGLPFASGSFDLVACASAVHHFPDPLPILAEMARASRGRVMIVDQFASEDPQEAAAMTELERLRDPSHAVSRPVSEQRRLLEAAGLSVVDERRVEHDERVSSWTNSREFPADRIAAVRRFIADRGCDTGMDLRPDGEDWVFRRRMVELLGEPC